MKHTICLHYLQPGVNDSWTVSWEGVPAVLIVLTSLRSNTVQLSHTSTTLASPPVPHFCYWSSSNVAGQLNNANMGTIGSTCECWSYIPINCHKWVDLGTGPPPPPPACLCNFTATCIQLEIEVRRKTSTWVRWSYNTRLKIWLQLCLSSSPSVDCTKNSKTTNPSKHATRQNIIHRQNKWRMTCIIGWAILTSTSSVHHTDNFHPRICKQTGFTLPTPAPVCVSISVPWLPRYSSPACWARKN